MTFDELLLFFRNFIETFEQDSIRYAATANEGTEAYYLMVNAKPDLRIVFEELVYDGVTNAFTLSLLVPNDQAVQLDTIDHYDLKKLKKTIVVSGNNYSNALSIAVNNICNDRALYPSADSQIDFNFGEKSGELDIPGGETRQISLDTVLNAILELDIAKFFDHFPPRKEKAQQ